MAITTFIPEVWSARLLDGLEKNLVYANLINRDYEGEISQMGDTVHINDVSDITIKKYTANTDIADPDQLTTSDRTLVIDQGDYFNFYVNDVDATQAKAPLMDKAMKSASYGLSDKTDQFIASLLATGSISTGLGNSTTPLVITATNVYETLIKMKTALDKASVQKAERWIVLPPDFEGLMLLDDRFASGMGANAEGRLKEGSVARAAGFDIYISNNVPNTSNAKYKVIASVNATCTYADQIIKTEAYRREKGFDDGIKGLHIYGGKLLRPDNVAVATVSFS